MRKAKAKLDRAIVEGAEKILHNRTLRWVVSADTTIRPRRPSLGAPSPTLSIERPTRSRSLPRYWPPPPPTEHPPAPPRNPEEVPLSPAEVSIYSPAEEEIPFSSAEESQYIEMSDLGPQKTLLELSGADSQVNPDEETLRGRSTNAGEDHSSRTASVSSASTEPPNDSMRMIMARLAELEALNKMTGRIAGYETTSEEGRQAAVHHLRLNSYRDLVGQEPVTYSQITALPPHKIARIKEIFDLNHIDELKTVRDVFRDEFLLREDEKQQTLELLDRDRPTSTPARLGGLHTHRTASPAASDILGIGATYPHINSTFTNRGEKVRFLEATEMYDEPASSYWEDPGFLTELMGTH